MSEIRRSDMACVSQKFPRQNFGPEQLYMCAECLPVKISNKILLLLHRLGSIAS